MIAYCYDEQGDAMSEKQVVAVVRRSAVRLSGLFPAQSFSVEDLQQEAFVRLLPYMPFQHPGALYVAAHRKIIDYHRIIIGQNKSKDRGGSHMFSHDEVDYDVFASKEPPPDRIVELKDQIEWAMNQLTSDDRRVVEAYAKAGDGAIKALANDLGISSSAVYSRHNRIMENMRNAAYPQKPDYRPSCKPVVRVAKNGKRVDRQRALERLATAR